MPVELKIKTMNKAVQVIKTQYKATQFHNKVHKHLSPIEHKAKYGTTPIRTIDDKIDGYNLEKFTTQKRHNTLSHRHKQTVGPAPIQVPSANTPPAHFLPQFTPQ